GLVGTSFAVQPRPRQEKETRYASAGGPSVVANRPPPPGFAKGAGGIVCNRDLWHRSRLSCPLPAAVGSGRSKCRTRAKPELGQHDNDAALASGIFLLTRVTRIFQKSVFTETTPGRPGGTPRRAFCCADAMRPRAA